jgi:hypothetical protein
VDNLYIKKIMFYSNFCGFKNLLRYNPNTFSIRYYEENFSTKQLKKKKNPWFSCENVNQGWKGCFIQQKKKG